MGEIILGSDQLQFIKLFENTTGTRVLDCLDSPEKIIFVVSEKDAGRAVGKDGANMKKLKDVFKKSIQVIAYNEDPVEFTKNIFRNYGVKDVVLEMRGNIKHATVTVEKAEKGKAIGKAGANLKLARIILLRHHDIQSVNVA